MKAMHGSKTLGLLAAGCLLAVAGLSAASAGSINFAVQIGSTPPPPPPVAVETVWAPPAPNAIWVAGHYEWNGAAYVWVPGYYTYPPQQGYVWVADTIILENGVYVHHRGHWREPNPGPGQVRVVPGPGYGPQPNQSPYPAYPSRSPYMYREPGHGPRPY